MSIRNRTRISDALKSAKILFWDFDGVIKDSTQIKSIAFEKLFTPFGEGVAEKVRLHHEQNGGMSRFEKLPIYLQWAGEQVTEQKISDYCEKFSKMVLQAVVDSEWVPGVREYLQENHKNQIFVLVTATPQEEIIEILNLLRISHFFISVFGSPLSKSLAIAQGLKSNNCKHTEAIMIGDARADYEAALSNQVEFIFRQNSDIEVLPSDFDGLSFNNLL
ncbi:HAD family hydrolase [Polynucleobacter paneuropaeus]|nr:HAD family hydrolase [Polynucleobacter paneuropaeus]